MVCELTLVCVQVRSVILIKELARGAERKVSTVWSVTTEKRTKTEKISISADSAAVKRKKMNNKIRSNPENHYPGRSISEHPGAEINNLYGLEGLHPFE